MFWKIILIGDYRGRCSVGQLGGISGGVCRWKVRVRYCGRCCDTGLGLKVYLKVLSYF